MDERGASVFERDDLRILAIETATEACSVALGDGRYRQQRYRHAPRQQTELLLPMVDELLQEAGWSLSMIDVFAYSAGPGAFSGVRLGAAAVQGLAFACRRPVLAVSSLQTLAQGAFRQHGEERVLALFDARMNEVYAAYYEVRAGWAQALAEDAVLAPGALPVQPGSWFLAGNGLGLAGLPGELQRHGEDAGLWPQALDVLDLARQQARAGLARAPEQALPVYLRHNVWKKLPGRSL